MLRATTPIEAAVPLHLQACSPTSACPQAQRCARTDAALCDRRNPIDGTALHVGIFCPLFVDARGQALSAGPPSRALPSRTATAVPAPRSAAAPAGRLGSRPAVAQAVQPSLLAPLIP